MAAAIFGLGEGGLDVGTAESPLYGLFWLLTGLAEAKALVLTIDDAHWCDTDSLRFVRYLGKRLAGLPMLLVLAARPNEPGVQVELLRGLAADLEVPTLHPAPLSRTGTAALVRERLGDAPGEAVASACHEATGGNPFLIEELLAELAATGEAAYTTPGQISAMGPKRIGVAVEERAARLDPLGLEVTRAAAVLGHAADLRALLALTGVERQRVAAIVDGLVGAAILAPGPGRRFVHPLVRAAVYERIPSAGRAELHTRAAAVLAAQGADPEAVAAHLLLCEPGSAAGALVMLERAAASAGARGAPDSAIAYLRRALAEPGADRAELLTALGGFEVVVRDPEAIPHLWEAAELTASPDQAIEVYLEFADLLSLAGQWDQTVAVVDAALARFNAVEPRRILDLEAFRAAYRGYDPERVGALDREMPRLRALVAEQPRASVAAAALDPRRARCDPRQPSRRGRGPDRTR